MYRVAGAINVSISPATWTAALVVVAGWVAGALFIANHIASTPQLSVPQKVLAAPEASQTPNRTAKAAREPFKKVVRLDDDIAGPNPDIVTPLPEDDGDDEGQTETGRASWYDLNTKTASGEAMDASALTAAHPTLPLGTEVRVANLDNGRAVVVRINDRGPFAKDRIIDLSRAAAEELGMIDAGVAHRRREHLVEFVQPYLPLHFPPPSCFLPRCGQHAKQHCENAQRRTCHRVLSTVLNPPHSPHSPHLPNSPYSPFK